MPLGEVKNRKIDDPTYLRHEVEDLGYHVFDEDRVDRHFEDLSIPVAKINGLLTYIITQLDAIYLRLDATNDPVTGQLELSELLVYEETTADLGNQNGAFAIDWDTTRVATVTLTGNSTATFSNTAPGKSITVEIVQGGLGTYTMGWPAAVKWPGGTEPVVTTGVGAIDIFVFYARDNGDIVGVRSLEDVS